MGVEVRRSAQGLTLELSGEWGARELTPLEAQLAAVDLRARTRAAHRHRRQ